MLTESMGWIATGLFAVSYVCRSPRALRWVQASAAVLWIAYGLLIGSRPVVAANIAVGAMALVSMRRAVSGTSLSDS